MKEHQGVITFVIFTIGIAIGSFIQSYWQRPVITALATTVVAKEQRIQEQEEDLLWYTQELVFAREGLDEMREQQEANNIIIMKLEDFYKVDLQEVRKGGDRKLDKLVAERLKAYKGMGGAE